MEAERQSHNVKEFGSDLTALSDPHWQARRQFLPGIAADAYGTSEYPHKRQAVVHGPPDHPCMDDVCCAHSSSQPVHPPARVLELQCCTEPALMQQMYQQSGREQQSSLHSSVAADAASAEAASSGHKHASRPPAYPAEKEQSKAGASLSHSSERQDERPAEGLPPAAEVEHGSPEQEDQGVSLVMDDDGGYVIPVLLTDMDIRMPVSMPARVPRSKAEPEAQAGRPRRSRAAALACQVRPFPLIDSCVALVQALTCILQRYILPINIDAMLHGGPGGVYNVLNHARALLLQEPHGVVC